MDIFSEFTGRIGGMVQGIDVSQVKVEAPRDASHGDLSTNAAMIASKVQGKPPRQIAEDIVARLKQDGDVETADVAGPGFVNWTLSDKFWQKTLGAILQAGVDYGRLKPLADTPDNAINVEYVSTNPTGPLHVAHARGAVFGDALASLLSAQGHPVVREYYINDAGGQVDVLARSAYLRYREAQGETVEIPSGLYPGDYLKPVGAALAEKYGKTLLDKQESEWLSEVRQFAIDAMMEMIRKDLERIGIKHDVFFSERQLVENGKVKEAIEALNKKGVIYEGILPRPKGSVEDWEEREQTLFRATDFGDDVDRPLMKSDGSYTYFASDIAYHFEKFSRGAKHLINVWGADHGGYVKRMQAAVKAITQGEGELDVRIIQLVKLLRNGEPVKMSKRSGDFVTLNEVIDEVGRDAIRFMMLIRKNDAPLDFDLAKVVEQSKDNPVFYVQYAYARIHSVYRQAKQAFPAINLQNLAGNTNFECIVDSAEKDVIKLLAAYPRLLAAAAAAKEPHRIAFYLFDLASLFHSLWNKGKDVPQLRFIRTDDEVWTKAHLGLLQAVENVLASGLRILGVSTPQEMR
ncbi:MAG: arginine--tRNA ligase [Pseudomonadota bacterium]